jgi:hypothetical protein
MKNCKKTQVEKCDETFVAIHESLQTIHEELGKLKTITGNHLTTTLEAIDKRALKDSKTLEEIYEILLKIIERQNELECT